MYYIVITKNNEMCAITFLKACTLSRISSARVTFYIQNFWKLLQWAIRKKKISRVPNLKKLYLEIFKYHSEKKTCRLFSKWEGKKNISSKKNVDCKSPMKWPICIFNMYTDIKTWFELDVLDVWITFIFCTFAICLHVYGVFHGKSDGFRTPCFRFTWYFKDW